MANASSSNEISSKLGKFSTLNPRDLEDSLAAFAKRFPVSGRIVHALAQDFGGVIGLAEHLEKNELWDDAEHWMATGKPVSMTPDQVHRLFDNKILDGVARHLAIPLESVEVQASLGIPKYFSTLGSDDNLDLGLGYNTKKKKSRTSAQGRTAPP